MKTKVINLDIYNQDVLVYFGEVGEVIDDVSQYLDPSEVESFMDELRGQYDARTIQIPGKGTIVYMPSVPTDAKGYAILSHEIFHAAYLVLRKAGVSCTDSSDEAYAYMIQFLTEKILTSISSSLQQLSSDACPHTTSGQNALSRRHESTSQPLE